MQLNKSIGVLLSATLVVGSYLVVGCTKFAPLNAKSTPPAAAQLKTSPVAATANPERSDPATLLAYKTGVARDKVQQILSIYEANAQSSDRGRDVYRIALFASEKTGVPTSQVGSIILSYNAM